MTDSELVLFKHQLRAAQAVASGLMHTIEGLLDRLDGVQHTNELLSTTCTHPNAMLQDARTMGFKNRFHCRQCDSMVDIRPLDQKAAS